MIVKGRGGDRRGKPQRHCLRSSALHGAAAAAELLSAAFCCEQATTAAAGRGHEDDYRQELKRQDTNTWMEANLDNFMKGRMWPGSAGFAVRSPLCPS